MIDIVLCLCPVLIEPFPIRHFFILHLLIHLLFDHIFFLFLLVHLGDKFSLAFGIPNPFLSSLLFFGKFNQSSLESNLLMRHHLEVVLSLHHVCLCPFNP